MNDMILEVKNLTTKFNTENGEITAVDDINFKIKQGEIVGLVGESGSGKSVTALSIMSLIPNPPGKITNGEILFQGEDLTKNSKDEIRKIRGNSISMIFQEPMTSLNPVYTIGNQLIEALTLHKNISQKEALEKSIDLLSLVGISLPEKRIKNYPHQFSGGMRQRVMIAMALACNPKLIIADEPTTALDVTIQAQILDLLKKIKNEFHTSVLLVTHDMGVVAQMCERVYVMYAGKIMEESETERIFEKPAHPYTYALLNSIPKLEGNPNRLFTIEGSLPNPFHLPKGCRFAPRCNRATDKCTELSPELLKIDEKQSVYCWNYIEYNKDGDSYD
jgi:oligopeptide/dipeptide ABC transporter ATP-binding protein